MKSHYWLILLSSLSLVGCKGRETAVDLDNLNSIKKQFLQAIFQEQVEESPFHLQYRLRTIFYSKNVVSLFGEIFVYDHLPHGSSRYEGKTFYKVKDQFLEVTLEDLFPTNEQKKFLQAYCEKYLKKTYRNLTYMVGENALFTSLPQEYIHTFALDDRFLLIIFQPYTVGGCSDGPFVVKIPFNNLEGHWNSTHPIHQLIFQAVSQNAFTSSWDEERSLS